MIRVVGCKKKYGDKVVLKDISLNIEDGDFAAIVGKNGSGKSTLVNLICKVKEADEGIIEYGFDEKDIYKCIGYQFQDADFDERMKVKTLCNLWKAIYKVSDNEFNELLGLLDLKEIMNNKIANISGGQKQKMNIFLALVNDPEVLILDEITTGLDAISRAEIRTYLKKISREKKKTILMVSHYMDEVQDLCNKVFFIKDGIIYESGTTEEIMDKYKVTNMDEALIKIIV